MFDLAALYQAGFRHTTCSFGTHLNPTQFEQLTQGLRTVFIALDGDEAGMRAAQHLAERLAERGQPGKRVFWPTTIRPATSRPAYWLRIFGACWMRRSHELETH